LRGDRIAEIGDHIEAPADARVAAGAGRTLLLGLIDRDSHAHVWDEQQLASSAAFGVTMVLDMLTSPATAGTMEQKVASPAGVLDDLPSAATRPPGRAVTAPSTACSSTTGTARASARSTARPWLPSWRRRTLRGRRAAAHVETQDDAREAREAGVDRLAHLFLGSAPPAGLVSDVEDGTTGARFETGRSVSTDPMMGGSSRAALSVTRPGARGSQGALGITGVEAGASANRWAGAMITPGAQPMAPVDLSSKKELVLHARGDGRPYLVLLSGKSRGYQPIARPIAVRGDWTEIRFPLASIDGVDGRDVMGVVVGTAEPGRFASEIDDVYFAP
jgi:hypothetical protein